MWHLRKSIYILLVTAILLVTGFIIYPQKASSAVGINKQISFQGKLVNTDGTNIPNGTYNMRFQIYQDGDGVLGGGDETLKWTEDRLRNSSQGVTVTDGVFQVNLGSVTALSGIDFNQSVLWLSVNLGNTNASCTPFSNCSPDGEMSPFIRFTAAPYAINSDLLDNLESTAFGQLALSNTWTAAQTIQAASSLTLGQGSTNTGAILFKNSTNANTLTLQSGASSSNLTFTLPTTYSSGGQCLQDNGSGVLSWTNCSGSGGANTALSNLASVAINTSLLPGSSSIDLGSSSSPFRNLYLVSNGIISSNGSSTGNIYIGNSSTEATPDILVLGQKSTTGNPNGVEGAMYYNYADHSFRCYENVSWKSCLGGLMYSTTSNSYSIRPNLNNDTDFDKVYSLPTGYCTTGRVYNIKAAGYYYTPNSGVGTIQVKLHFGKNGASAAYPATTGTLNNLTSTNPSWREWYIDVFITCRNTTTLVSNGYLYMSDGNRAATGMREFNIPDTPSTTTVDNLADTAAIHANWSAGGNTNELYMTQFTITTTQPTSYN